MLQIWRRFAYATKNLQIPLRYQSLASISTSSAQQLQLQLNPNIKTRGLHSSSICSRKKRKSQVHQNEENGADSDAVKMFDSNFIVSHGVKEMNELEVTFMDELSRSLSLKIDLRTYEEFVVKTDDGKQHKLNRLGRIKLVTPLLISIDFSDNPTMIKPTKLAIEQSKLGVSPRQEGTMLYISVPRITRERRESLANVATKKLLNEYRKALNEVYSKYDKEVEDHEEAQKIMGELLKEKKSHEKKAIHLIEERRTKLLTEVI